MNKDTGIAAVWEKSAPWSHQAMTTLKGFIARKRNGFTVDDFRQYAIEMGLGEPHHYNAWGALFNVARQQGWIRSTGNVLPSVRPQAHKRLICEWRKS